MKKVTLLERPQYQAMYRIAPVSRYVTLCSPYQQVIGLVRDSSDSSDAWESFGTDSLLSYFSNGLKLIRENTLRLENLSRPYSDADEKELLFMAEALVHARHLMQDSVIPEIASER